MRWLLVLLLIAATVSADPVIESKQYLNHSAGEMIVGYQFKVGATGPGGIVYSFIDDEIPGTSYTAFQFSDYGATRSDSLQLRMDATWGAGHFSVSPIVGDSFIIVCPGRSDVSVKRYNIFTNTLEDTANYGFYSSDELLAQPMYVDDTTVVLVGRDYTTATPNPFWAISYDKGATFSLGGGPIACLASLGGSANQRVGITRNGDSTVAAIIYEPGNYLYSAIFNMGDYGPNFIMDSIEASADDAGYNNTGGTWSNSTTDHYLGYSTTYGALGPMQLRFSIAVPQGAVIDSAFLRLRPQAVVGGGDSLLIQVEDTANATAFSSEADATTNRHWTTTGQVRNTGTTWTGDTCFTDNIASCIQVPVDRGDWSSGNYIGLRLAGLTTSGATDLQLRMRSGDYSGTVSDPHLYVYYHIDDKDAAWSNLGSDSLILSSTYLRRKMSMTTSLDGGTYVSCSDTAATSHIIVACLDSGATDWRIDTVTTLTGAPFQAANGPITALTCDQWANRVTLAYTADDSTIAIKQYDPATQTWDASPTSLATGQVQNIAGFNPTDSSFHGRWVFSYRRAVATDTCFTMVLVDSAATQWGVEASTGARIIIIGE